jgi:hypothetical protein
LSNAETAALIEDAYHHALQALCLCHLSAENNSPLLAHQALHGALLRLGADARVDLHVLPRDTAYELQL